MQHTTRTYGVLTRIALCYLVAGLIFLYVRSSAPFRDAIAFFAMSGMVAKKPAAPHPKFRSNNHHEIINLHVLTSDARS